jgi:hypothetical protein
MVTLRVGLPRWTRYLEGAFGRALPAGAPRLAVSRAPVTPVITPVAHHTAAVLDPFAIYASFHKEGLRTRLLPLTRTALLTIIERYDLDPARLSLARLSTLQLGTFITTAVEVQWQRGRR